MRLQSKYDDGRLCVCVVCVAKVADAAAEADAAERTNRGKMEKIQIGQDVSVCVCARCDMLGNWKRARTCRPLLP